MNRFIFSLFLGLTTLSLVAQTIKVDELADTELSSDDGIFIRQIKLKNGLRVYLNPDPNMTDVLGAVVVRGGANHDPEGAEGTAHYFEHMMFKGSTSIGTVDYKAEKVYLDSIREAYDLLAYSKGDEQFRNGILKNIDRMSQKAAQYAIPNEFNEVLSAIGGTQINAYTTYENIVYHNHFPAESMNQWIKLQVDRFENPVFRLFQSELETVYEEKNMSMDNSFRGIFEELYKSFYPNSVYGKQSVLGSVESLKIPSISKMETYFKEYYIASNMALILVGNFNADQVAEELEQSFGKWRDGQFQEVAKASEPPFEGRKQVKMKLSPIPLGILGFRTVEKGNKDELALEVINELLTNDESTGLLDKLAVNNELMYVTSINDQHYDIGANFIVFVPKPIIQSLKSGEKKVLAQLEKLKNGDFDDQLLKAIITKKRKQFTLNLENSDFRSQLIIDAFMSHKSVNELLARNKQLEQMDKSTIQRIAQKYYGANYLAFLSKMGFPKKTKLDKPNITPLKPQNKGMNSAMAIDILSMHKNESEPRFIDFNTDVTMSDFFDNLHFYYVKNPMNNIYSLEFKIGIGTYEMPELTVVADYLNLVGSKQKSFSEFRTALQAQGVSINCYTDKSYFYIKMTGFDSSLELDMMALKQLLRSTELNSNTLKKVVKDYSMEYKMLKSDISMQSRLLQDFAIYGENSPYLKRMGKKEMKKLKPVDIIASINKLLTYETDIHYVGQLSVDEAKMAVKRADIFKLGLKTTNSPVILKLPLISQNQLYFMNNKKAVQSHIRLTAPSKEMNKEDRDYVDAFNKYFGLGMSSVMFREVREYRSLAYGVYAYVLAPEKLSRPTYLYAAMTTQGDKTNEAMDVFTNLVDSMPVEATSIQPLKQSLLNSFNSQMPTFRQLSLVVARWKHMGYSADPRVHRYSKIMDLDMNQLMRFYADFVRGRKRSVSVVGDAKRIDMDRLKKEGNYHEVKLKQIYKK